MKLTSILRKVKLMFKKPPKPTNVMFVFYFMICILWRHRFMLTHSLTAIHRFPGWLARVPAPCWNKMPFGFPFRAPEEKHLQAHQSRSCLSAAVCGIKECVLSFSATQCHPAVWCQPRWLPPLVAASHCQALWCPWCAPAGAQVSATPVVLVRNLVW